MLPMMPLSLSSADGEGVRSLGLRLAGDREELCLLGRLIDLFLRFFMDSLSDEISEAAEDESSLVLCFLDFFLPCFSRSGERDFRSLLESIDADFLL